MKNVELNGQGLHIHHINVVFSSSRDPNIKIRKFLNELESVVPNSIKINRGKLNTKELIRRASSLGASYLVIITKRKGNPGAILVYDLVMGGILKYKYAIKGIALLSEMRIKRVSRKIERGCIGDIECDEVKDFLIDLGFRYIDNCEAFIYAVKEENNGDICKIFVKDSDGNLISPVFKIIPYESGNRSITERVAK